MNDKQKVDNLAIKLIELERSTTEFLESFRNARLKVKIKSQSEHNSVITRVTVLFFDHPDKPVLYCVSYLNKAALTNKEYHLLKDTDTPIGRIFTDENKDSIIFKKDISVTLTSNETAGTSLNTGSMLLYEKTYEYCVAHRNIGQIIEFFNEESLSRV